MDSFNLKQASFLFYKKDLLTLLESENLFLNKTRGQNFIVDISIRQKMMSFIPDSSHIIEIGCGLGHFTVFLLEKASSFLGIEIDKGFHAVLTKTFPAHTFFHQDILTYDFNTLKTSPLKKPFILVGNIPYNITTKIIQTVLDTFPLFDSFFVLLQKEYALEKLHFKDQDTGLSPIFCQLYPYYSIHSLTKISSECFFPKPHVNSLFLELRRKEVPLFTSYNFLYFKIIHTLFLDPRKKLKHIENEVLKLCQNDSILKNESWMKISSLRIKELKISEIIDLYSLIQAV